MKEFHNVSGGAGTNIILCWVLPVPWGAQNKSFVSPKKVNFEKKKKENSYFPRILSAFYQIFLRLIKTVHVWSNF